MIFRDYYICVSISSRYYPETSISARWLYGWRLIPDRYGKTRVMLFHHTFKSALQKKFRKNNNQCIISFPFVHAIKECWCLIFIDYYMCFSISSWYYPETSISARGPLGQRADMGRGIIPGRYGKTHVIIFLSRTYIFKDIKQPYRICFIKNNHYIIPIFHTIYQQNVDVSLLFLSSIRRHLLTVSDAHSSRWRHGKTQYQGW